MRLQNCAELQTAKARPENILTRNRHNFSLPGFSSLPGSKLLSAFVFSDTASFSVSDSLFSLLLLLLLPSFTPELRHSLPSFFLLPVKLRPESAFTRVFDGNAVDFHSGLGKIEADKRIPGDVAIEREFFLHGLSARAEKSEAALHGAARGKRHVDLRVLGKV